MAQGITLFGASYSNVPAVLLPKTGGGTARFDDASVTTAVAADVTSGKIFLAADGTPTTGTGSGGGNDFVIMLTANDSTGYWEPDKTVAEAWAAYQNGKTITVNAGEIPAAFIEVSSSSFQYYVLEGHAASAGNYCIIERTFICDSSGSVSLAYEYYDYDTSDGTAAAADVAAGCIFYSSSGRAIGTAASRIASDLTVSGATVTAPAGIYYSAASKSVASGTAGTPTATKGTVSNHSVSVTPSVTNTTGYITGSTKTRTAVTVSASELVSGTKSITANGTGIDVTDYASVDVAVSGGGGNEFVVTLTQNSSTGNWEPDKTFAQLSAARTSGDIITLTFDGEPTGYTTVPIQWDWYDNGATFWYYTCWPDFDNIVGADGAWVHDDYYFTANGLNRDSRSIFEEPKILGTKTITANGTYNAITDAKDGYSSVTVNVPTSGKAFQIVQGTTRTVSASMSAIGAEMTVSKTGTYDVYWSAFRSSTSGSYTFATQLYVAGSAYGSENSTWTNHVQNNHLSNVSLTANQKIRVYGRESRSASYYVYAPTLVIVES